MPHRGQLVRRKAAYRVFYNRRQFKNAHNIHKKCLFSWFQNPKIWKIADTCAFVFSSYIYETGCTTAPWSSTHFCACPRTMWRTALRTFPQSLVKSYAVTFRCPRVFSGTLISSVIATDQTSSPVERWRRSLTWWTTVSFGGQFPDGVAFRPDLCSL